MPSNGFSRRMIGFYFCFKCMERSALCGIYCSGAWVKTGKLHKWLLKNAGKKIWSLELGYSSGDDGKQLDSGCILKVKIKGFFVDVLDSGLKETKELKTTVRLGG